MSTDEFMPYMVNPSTLSSPPMSTGLLYWCSLCNSPLFLVVILITIRDPAVKDSAFKTSIYLGCLVECQDQSCGSHSDLVSIFHEYVELYLTLP